MKLPTSEPRNFVLNMRQSLMGSMGQRARDCANWDSIFYAGSSVDNDRPAIVNIVASRVRTRANNLWSPDNVTWRLEYELGAPDPILQQAAQAGSYISRELRDANADLEFGDAVELAIRHGSSFLQLVWDGEELCADVVQMSSVGVMNEKAKGLYGKDQGAFMVSYSVPAEQFAELVLKFSGTGDIARAFDNREGSAAAEMNDVTRLVLGLNQPIGSPSGSQAGFINLLPRVPYIPSANSLGRQVSVDVIWFQREDGRWATVFVVEGNETIGTDYWRNFMAVSPTGTENPDLAKLHPYIYLCPDPTKGQMFGRSGIADIAEAQAFIRKHGLGLDHILDMQEDPAHIGYGAINTPDVYRQQLRAPGGFVNEPGVNAKVQPQIPQMPPQLIEALELVTEGASDAANSPPVVQGRGERGVRAGAHADTLVTTASARERRAAIRTVRQAGDLGHLALEILRVKNADNLSDGADGTFTLETLPSGYHVYCNGHTASPLFASEYVSMVDELLRAGSIGPEEYLELRNPAGYDMLRNALRKREAAQQKIVQSLPPEDRVKLLSHTGGKK